MNLNRISAVLDYYRLNHGFYEPYEVMLDGNFLKLMVERGQPFVRKLEELLNGKVFSKVTECIVRELQLLGEKFRFVLEEAKQHQLVKCRHMLGTTPKACIEQLIGNANPKRYMVCTQDLQLRRAVRELPNVPIFYFGPDQRITMEEVSKRHINEVKESFRKKQLPAEHEQKELQTYKQQKEQTEKELKKKEILQNLSAQGLKAKKLAKGPNPLSVKKQKRVKPSKQQQSNNNVPQRKKRIRKRKPKQQHTSADQQQE